MQDILNIKNKTKFLELNEYQCGTYTEHSLEEAQNIAQNILHRGVGINKKMKIYF